LKRLSALLARIPDSKVIGSSEIPISDVTTDSRRVRSGALFVALRGEHVDGHEYVAAALGNGASAVVVEQNGGAAASDVAVVRVPDTRRALSAIAAAFYDDPSRTLQVAGVTGTSGKTTTTYMIAAILASAGTPCGTIGTVGATFGTRSWALDNTTPLAHELHALLAQMREAGARGIAMEVSSHALALGRVDDVDFAVGVLTNITRDHLDFHRTLEAYARAKQRLIERSRSVVLNAGDAYGALWAEEFRSRKLVITYALGGNADIVPGDVILRSDSSEFSLDAQRFVVNIPGAFNVANALAAIGAARALGIDDRTSARGLESLGRVPGRMERIGNGDVDVIVDYAHKPDALENVLRTLRAHRRGQIAIVFGCGGDRDRGKRAEMGRIAAALADRIYLTNDNPRTEDPRSIVAEIERGVGEREHVVELDRRTAIERAVREAVPGEVVLVAGKGHEPYQIIGTRVLPFDDAAVAREALARRRHEASTR
jgi:UDP-N-acetylmuramoyl-L-alanyl-D-glutamate--2,6-diaminopimelate ligase